jgi:hypothetical protein
MNELTKSENYRASESYASRVVNLLLRSFPQQKPHDPEVYVRQLVSLLAGQPEVTLKLMVNAGSDLSLVRQARFLPTLAEVSDWLGENLPGVAEPAAWRKFPPEKKLEISPEERERGADILNALARRIRDTAYTKRMDRAGIKFTQMSEMEAAPKRLAALANLESMRGEK